MGNQGVGMAKKQQLWGAEGGKWQKSTVDHMIGVRPEHGGCGKLQELSRESGTGCRAPSVRSSWRAKQDPGPALKNLCVLGRTGLVHQRFYLKAEWGASCLELLTVRCKQRGKRPHSPERLREGAVGALGGDLTLSFKKVFSMLLADC